MVILISVAVLMAVFVLTLPLQVWIYVRLERKEQEKMIQKIHAGDIYTLKSVDDNPFNDNQVVYAGIDEVRVNKEGEAWVRYFIHGVPKTVRLKTFLDIYKPVKSEEDKL